MTPDLMLFVGLAMLAGLLGSGAMMLRDLRRQERLDQRIRGIHGQTSGRPGLTDLTEVSRIAIAMVAVLGRAIMRSGLLSRKSISDLEKTLAGSGMRSTQGLALFVGSKIVLMIMLPVATWLGCVHLGADPSIRTLAPAIAGVGGLMLPDWMIRKYRSR